MEANKTEICYNKKEECVADQDDIDLEIDIPSEQSKFFLVDNVEKEQSEPGISSVKVKNKNVHSLLSLSSGSVSKSKSESTNLNLNLDLDSGQDKNDSNMNISRVLDEEGLQIEHIIQGKRIRQPVLSIEEQTPEEPHLLQQLKQKLKEKTAERKRKCIDIAEVDGNSNNEERSNNRKRLRKTKKMKMVEDLRESTKIIRESNVRLLSASSAKNSSLNNFLGTIIREQKKKLSISKYGNIPDKSPKLTADNTIISLNHDSNKKKEIYNEPLVVILESKEDSLQTRNNLTSTVSKELHLPKNHDDFHLAPTQIVSDSEDEDDYSLKHESSFEKLSRFDVDGLSSLRPPVEDSQDVWNDCSEHVSLVNRLEDSAHDSHDESSLQLNYTESRTGSPDSFPKYSSGERSNSVTSDINSEISQKSEGKSKLPFNFFSQIKNTIEYSQEVKEKEGSKSNLYLPSLPESDEFHEMLTSPSICSPTHIVNSLQYQDSKTQLVSSLQSQDSKTQLVSSLQSQDYITQRQNTGENADKLTVSDLIEDEAEVEDDFDELSSDEEFDDSDDELDNFELNEIDNEEETKDKKNLQKFHRGWRADQDEEELQQILDKFSGRWKEELLDKSDSTERIGVAGRAKRIRIDEEIDWGEHDEPVDKKVNDAIKKAEEKEEQKYLQKLQRHSSFTEKEIIRTPSFIENEDSRSILEMMEKSKPIRQQRPSSQNFTLGEFVRTRSLVRYPFRNRNPSKLKKLAEDVKTDQKASFSSKCAVFTLDEKKPQSEKEN